MEAQSLSRARIARRGDRRRPTATAAMWAGIAFSIVLLTVLLARGWGGDAWAIAAGMLFVICIGVCAFSAIVGNRSARAVDQAVARLADARRSAGSGEPPDAAHHTPARVAVDGHQGTRVGGVVPAPTTSHCRRRRAAP